MKRKIYAIIFALLFLGLSCYFNEFPSKASTAHTQTEAVAWANSKVGVGLDYDGVYGNQCVDLIKYYYAYLGVGDYAYGNACDYASNTLPPGWTRVYSDFKPGDIAVWKTNHSCSTCNTGSLGHVGIIDSADSVGFNAVNQNFGEAVDGTGVCKKVWFYCSALQCAIRPDFNTHIHSYTSSITKAPTCTEKGVRTYTCTCGNEYTEDIAATGHKYTDKVVLPTFTEKGYTLHTCSVCGNMYKDKYVDSPELNDDGWYYGAALPENITPDNYTIEYNNYYEKVQKDSPGTDWKKGETVKNEWQNSGEVYTSESDLATSDFRVLVKSVYYHFCGPNAGDAGNYAQTGKFVHYDELEIGKFGLNVVSTGNDEGHTYYLLDWSDGGGRVRCKSGVSCDGSYGTHGERCQVWYKMNYYQNRVKVEQYKYTKSSGWVSECDSAAQSVEIRFKEKSGTDISDTPSEYTPGDLNTDGTVNSTDVILLRRYIAGGYNVTINEKAADVNADGTINSTDVILIRRYIAGGYGVVLK